jgi:hypothetical protein
MRLNSSPSAPTRLPRGPKTGIQREIRLGQWEQQTLQRLLDAIEQRFPRGGSAADPHADGGGDRAQLIGAQGRGLAER